MVARRWEEITSMEEAEAYENHQESTGIVMAKIADTLNEEQEAGEEKGIKDAIGYESKPYNFRYSFRYSNSILENMTLVLHDQYSGSQSSTLFQSASPPKTPMV